MYNDWRDRIADCVHEDTRQRQQADRYRAMIREWAGEMVGNARPTTIPARERVRREHPDWTDEQVTQELRRFDLVLQDGTRRRGEEALDVLCDPIAITTHAGTPLKKKYATLAAIHDGSNHCDFPLKPWAGKQFDWAPLTGPWADGSPGPDTVAPEEYRDAWMSLTYANLIHAALELTDDDRPGIERIYNDVARDLEQHCGGRSLTRDSSSSASVPEALLSSVESAPTQQSGSKFKGVRDRFDPKTPLGRLEALRQLVELHVRMLTWALGEKEKEKSGARSTHFLLNEKDLCAMGWRTIDDLWGGWCDWARFVECRDPASGRRVSIIDETLRVYAGDSGCDSLPGSAEPIALHCRDGIEHVPSLPIAMALDNAFRRAEDDLREAGIPWRAAPFFQNLRDESELFQWIELKNATLQGVLFDLEMWRRDCSENMETAFRAVWRSEREAESPAGEEARALTPGKQTSKEEPPKYRFVQTTIAPDANLPDDDAWLTHVDIAQRVGADPERVRKRLDRYRAKNHDCFREVSDRKPREPQYLYHVKAIRPVIAALLASSQPSGERPARNS